jgi:hypothetical protein
MWLCWNGQADGVVRANGRNITNKNKEAWLTIRNHSRNAAGLTRYLLLGLMFLSYPGWSSEASLRVAFVYNFIKFIQWPPGSEATENPSFHLCALGAQSEVRTALGQINGKALARQVVKVVFLDDSASVNAGLASCQMLYRPEHGLPLALPHPLPAGVVLVADEPAAGTPDVALSLVRNGDGPLEFQVDQVAMAQAGVTVSSQLLKLAKNTRGSAR